MKLGVLVCVASVLTTAIGSTEYSSQGDRSQVSRGERGSGVRGQRDHSRDQFQGQRDQFQGQGRDQGRDSNQVDRSRDDTRQYDDRSSDPCNRQVLDRNSRNETQEPDWKDEHRYPPRWRRRPWWRRRRYWDHYWDEPWGRRW